MAFSVLAAIAALWLVNAPLASAAVSEESAIGIANQDANVVREEAENGPLAPVAERTEGHWEVGYFVGGEEVALVLVDPKSGDVKLHFYTFGGLLATSTWAREFVAAQSSGARR